MPPEAARTLTIASGVAQSSAPFLAGLLLRDAPCYHPRMSDLRRIPSLVIVLALAAAPAALAETRTYPGAPPCGTTLQACLDGAGDGDRIEIVTTAPIGETLMIDRSVTLTGATGVTPVIGGTVTPHGVMIVANASGPSTVLLQGLTLSNAGIRVNQFLGAGGDRVTIDRCSISSTSGGSTVLVDPDVPVDVVIQNSILASGGYVVDSLMAAPSGSTTLTLLGNRITAATSGYDGINLDMRGGGQITVNVLSNVVHDVTVDGITAYTLDSVHATVNVLNNTVDHAGDDALSVKSVSPASTLTLNVFNNILSRATSAGVDLPASAQLSFVAGFNDLFGNGVPDELNGASLGAPLFAVDPLFVDATGADYHLKPASSLVNAGTNAPPAGLPATDADGNVRIASGVVDIGAFEFGSGPPTTTSTSTTTTTLPPCASEATFVSVTCRIAQLAADVGVQLPAGTLRDKVLAALATADASVQAGSTAATPKDRRRALRPAIRAFAACGKRLRSRAAKAIDRAVRSALLDRVALLKSDVKALGKR